MKNKESECSLSALIFKYAQEFLFLVSFEVQAGKKKKEKADEKRNVSPFV